MSAKKIGKPCLECGEEYEVAVNMASRSRFCPPCAKAYERQLQQERDRQRLLDRRAKTGPVRHTTSTTFKLIYDPDGLWGNASSQFTSEDVKLMLSKGYLTPGTRFARRDGLYTVNGKKLVRMV